MELAPLFGVEPEKLLALFLLIYINTCYLFLRFAYDAMMIKGGVIYGAVLV